jgi:hypothetical protein
MISTTCLSLTVDGYKNLILRHIYKTRPRLTSKFAKYGKKIVCQKCNMGIQNKAGFGADFESVEKVPKKLTRKKVFYNFLGDFLVFFFVLYSALLHLPPLRFHCADGCWDRTQDRCNWCIGSQTL